jgi:ABC-2 type transport system permease protein
VLARRQFMHSLRREDSFRPAAIANKVSQRGIDVVGSLTRCLPDPFGALVEKEFRTLVRMPRFRVLFGMACVFSIFVFMPVVMRVQQNSFVGQNALPITSMYGLLLLSDALLLNVFGFDRGATQVYFVTPLSISAVIRAKNLAAIAFVALQSTAVPLLLFLFQVKFSWLSLAAGFLSATVETVFLLAAGNLLSVLVPRPIDPRTSLRQQSGGKMQMWLLACTVGMFLLVGAAFLARWATDRDWVLMAALALELAIGLLVYRISLDSTIAHALTSREQIVTALSKSASPVSS